MSKRARRHWRVQSGGEGEFDELVISPHVHLEMMDKHCLWIRLGDKMTTVDLRTGQTMPWKKA